jgi:tetratricopeptide (TPR) repeat protein
VSNQFMMFQTFVRPVCIGVLCALMSTQAMAQNRPARAVTITTASPVTLVRSDADLFAATLAGRYAQGVSDPALAAQAWALAYQRQPGSGDMFARALDANLQAGLVDRAVLLAKSAPPTILTDDGALVLAFDAFAQGRYRDVSRLLNTRTFAPSKRLIADHLRAFALLGENKGAEAVNLTSTATGIAAIDKAALISRAMILDAVDRDDEAGILFQSAVATNVIAPLGMRAYADWLVKSGQTEEAKRLYRRLISAGGPDTIVFVAALDGLDRAPAVNPASAADLRARAAIGIATIALSLTADGRSVSPTMFLSLVSFLDPRSDGVALALAGRWIDEGKGNLARSSLSRISASSPEYLAARTELVWLEFATDKPLAIQLARQTFQARPNDLAAKRLLADVLAGNRNDAEAEGLYSSLIERGLADGRPQSELWPYYFGRGGARERQGKWPEARADLRQAKAAAPNQPSILNYLGYALAERGENIEEALTLLQNAVRLRPQSANILDSLGWAQFKAGRFEAAVASLERAAGMDSTIGEISDHLGDAYWRTGRTDEARLEWQRALRLDLSETTKVNLARKIRDGLPPLARTP